MDPRETQKMTITELIQKYPWMTRCFIERSWALDRRVPEATLRLKRNRDRKVSMLGANPDAIKLSLILANAAITATGSADIVPEGRRNNASPCV